MHTSADLRPQPTLDELATAASVEGATAVDVTQRCRALSRGAALPRDYVGKSVYVSRRQWKAAAQIERERLAALDRCIATTHDSYARGLPTK